MKIETNKPTTASEKEAIAPSTEPKKSIRSKPFRNIPLNPVSNLMHDTVPGRMIARDAAKATRDAGQSYMKCITINAKKLAEHAKRTKVMKTDVIEVLRSNMCQAGWNDII